MEIPEITEPCCDICEHCFYTGLPGAYACEQRGFTDLFDVCESFEVSEWFLERYGEEDWFKERFINGKED